MPRRSRTRRHVVLLGLVLVGLVAGGPGCASSGSRFEGDDDGYRKENEKSPFVALLLAIFPGFFVHGLGNAYAGKQSRAEELMAEEGLGIGALAVGAGLGGLGYLEHRQGDKADGAQEILHRIGEAGSFAGAAGFTGFGLVMFFDSWIRDMIEAGDAAEEHNKELRRQHDLTKTVPEDRAADITTAGAPSSWSQRPWQLPGR